MNILVINNETKRIDELMALLEEHTLTERTPMHIAQDEVDVSDVIILTGSHTVSLANNESYFSKEIELIKTMQKPIIGICLGFQLIANAFEGFVNKMPLKQQGIKNIQVVGHDPLFDKRESFKVYSCHRWMVNIIDFPLLGLARSEDGWEIVKHATKNVYGFQFHPEVIEENYTDGKWLFERVLNSLVK